MDRDELDLGARKATASLCIFFYLPHEGGWGEGRKKLLLPWLELPAQLQMQLLLLPLRHFLRPLPLRQLPLQSLLVCSSCLLSIFFFFSHFFDSF